MLILFSFFFLSLSEYDVVIYMNNQILFVDENNENVLDWERRLQIALDAAQGKFGHQYV